MHTQALHNPDHTYKKTAPKARETNSSGQVAFCQYVLVWVDGFKTSDLPVARALVIAATAAATTTATVAATTLVSTTAALVSTTTAVTSVSAATGATGATAATALALRLAGLAAVAFCAGGEAVVAAAGAVPARVWFIDIMKQGTERVSGSNGCVTKGRMKKG